METKRLKRKEKEEDGDIKVERKIGGLKYTERNRFPFLKSGHPFPREPAGYRVTPG